MSGLTVAQWRRLVFASQDDRMTSAVKVLCLYLADHMNQRNRKVSIPRGTIARDLGVHQARVGERLTKAVEAGFLSRVSRGYHGRTSEYQATRPESILRSGTQPAAKVTAPPDAKGVRGAVCNSENPERESQKLHTALLDANTEADLSPVGHHRDVGNDEEVGA